MRKKKEYSLGIDNEVDVTIESRAKNEVQQYKIVDGITKCVDTEPLSPIDYL